MATGMGDQINRLLSDESLDAAAKIAKLRQWETDALARQRASTEGMESSGDRDGDDLKAIEAALMSLGEDAVDQGPASL